jgi:iron complex transport system permease protein
MFKGLKTTFGFSFQMVVLAMMLLLLIGVSTSMGYLALPYGRVFSILISKLPGLASLANDIDPLQMVVVMDVRLPRILCAALVGGGLAVCGAVFQGILLNPLADPYTLGVSAGAAFGASMAILLNILAVGFFSIPLFAFAGACTTLLLVLYLSATGEGFASNNLILSGIIVAAILSAGISFLKYLADEQVGVIIFWLMGSFASKTWHEVLLNLVAALVVIAVGLFFARDLNLYALGQRAAGSLGVDARKLALILMVTASLTTAACVSTSGIIGFVGLLVPHLMRSLVGPDNRRLIPAVFLAGAVLLLAADTLTRAVLPREIPIGVLTALIGGPFFCYIYRQRQVKDRVY